MARDTYESKIKISFHEETVNGQLWLIAIMQDNGIGWSWDEMPERVWEKYHHSKQVIEDVFGGVFDYKAEKDKGAVITASLKVNNLETANLYKKMIETAILKWQPPEIRNRNKRGLY